MSCSGKKRGPYRKQSTNVFPKVDGFQEVTLNVIKKKRKVPSRNSTTVKEEINDSTPQEDINLTDSNFTSAVTEMSPDSTDWHTLCEKSQGTVSAGVSSQPLSHDDFETTELHNLTLEGYQP